MKVVQQKCLYLWTYEIWDCICMYYIELIDICALQMMEYKIKN